VNGQVSNLRCEHFVAVGFSHVLLDFCSSVSPKLTVLRKPLYLVVRDMYLDKLVLAKEACISSNIAATQLSSVVSSSSALTTFLADIRGIARKASLCSDKP
jgi:hypothetical protein